jgi:membrane protease YdiL (CAAX protease family)
MNKETRNLIVFMLATFAATWASYFTIVFNGWDPYSMPGMAFLLLGGSAPSWVGVLVVLFTYDKERRRDYFRRCISFKQIKLPYWVFIISVFPLIFALIIGAEMLMGGSLPEATNLKAFIAQPWIIPLALVMSFLSGPWSEEFGWRGYALDPLLRRFGVLRGSLVLGFIWGIWHLPLFWMPQTWHGRMGFRFEGFWTFMLYSIGLAMMMTWVYLRTNRSILSGFMMHLTSNFTGNLFQPYSDRMDVMRMAATLVLGLALCLLAERRATQEAGAPVPILD